MRLDVTVFCVYTNPANSFRLYPPSGSTHPKELFRLMGKLASQDSFEQTAFSWSDLSTSIRIHRKQRIRTFDRRRRSSRECELILAHKWDNAQRNEFRSPTLDTLLLMIIN